MKLIEINLTELSSSAPGPGPSPGQYTLYALFTPGPRLCGCVINNCLLLLLSLSALLTDSGSGPGQPQSDGSLLTQMRWRLAGEAGFLL